MRPVFVTTLLSRFRSMLLVAAILLGAVSVATAQFPGYPPADSVTFPPDSLFKPNIVIATFQGDVIDPEYFCLNPWPGGGLPKTTTESYITPNSSLITDTLILNFLTLKAATLEPLWPPCSDPCLEINRYEITQWGDTLHFPYWKRFIVHFGGVNPARFAYEMFLADSNVIAEPVPSVEPYVAKTIQVDDNYYANHLDHQQGLRAPGGTYWGINMEAAWDITTGDPDVKMACLDSQFDPDHPDFWDFTSEVDSTSNIVKAVNFQNRGADVVIGPEGHGLFVSGIMGALTNNHCKGCEGDIRTGIAGVAGGDWNQSPPAMGPSFYLGDVLGGDAWRNVTDALDEWTTGAGCNDHVRVFNMSFGSKTRTTIRQAGGTFDSYLGFARAYRRCAVMCNANQEAPLPYTDDGLKGDQTPTAPDWKYFIPGGYNDEWFIGVSASRVGDGALATFASWGGNIRLLAPGTYGYVWSTAYFGYGSPDPFPTWADGFYPDYGLDEAGGTSRACPHVSGVAALILSKNPNLLNDDVAGLMEGTARKVFYYPDQNASDPGNKTVQRVPYDQHTGYGLLDAGAAVAQADNVQYGNVKAYDLPEGASLTIDSTSGLGDYYYPLVIGKTEETDRSFLTGGVYFYVAKRIKVTIHNVPVSGSVGQKLAHVWGIGLGHNAIANTVGWEPGAVNKTFSAIPQGLEGVIGAAPELWCSQTPYAKVDTNSINPNNRTFSIHTYVWEIRQYWSLGPPFGVSLGYFPTSPQNVSMSYGYFIGDPTWAVDEQLVPPVSGFSLTGVYPNPTDEQTVYVKLSVLKPSIYTIGVYDILGRTVIESHKTDRLESGSYSLPLTVPSSIPAGTYYCRVSAGENKFSTSMPFTIMR